MGQAVGKTIRQDEKFGKNMLEDLDLFGVDKFDENNIEIPFPHCSIYFGEKSRHFDLQLLEKLQNRENPID